MEDISVTLHLRAYREQIEDSKIFNEFKDKSFYYKYVESIDNNGEDIDKKIEKMYFVGMIKFLNDYIKKHPEFKVLYRKILFGEIIEIDKTILDNKEINDENYY